MNNTMGNILSAFVIVLAVISLFTFVFGIGFIGGGDECGDPSHFLECDLVGVEDE